MYKFNSINEFSLSLNQSPTTLLVNAIYWAGRWSDDSTADEGRFKPGPFNLERFNPQPIQPADDSTRRRFNLRTFQPTDLSSFNPRTIQPVYKNVYAVCYQAFVIVLYSRIEMLSLAHTG
ncbi:unnamed protein product [Clavelina lepadiformis]|uniref:Uncharacterized protein n=1 Tax=Clavelina lepadiformis TaxID=159417 RepID=A0ABP0GDQ2_CLALP